MAVCGAVAAVVCVMHVPADAARGGEKSAGSGKAAQAPLVWPLPPEAPRIRYVRSYQGVNDFKPAKKPSKFALMLLGPSDAQGWCDPSKYRSFSII